MNMTKFIQVIIFTLLVTSLPAQNWRVNGNTNAQLGGSLTPSIGTNQNRPLLFQTNNTERMRLTANGLLGIGTTAPSSVLEVNATPLGTGEVFRTNAPAAQNTFWRMFSGNSPKTACN